MNYENEMMFINACLLIRKTSFMIDKFGQSEYEDFISYFKNVIPFLNNFDLCFTKELTF